MTTKNKRKPRRKLRKGRVAFALTVLAIIICGFVALISWLVGGFSGCTRGVSDRVTVIEAVEAGQRDAEKAVRERPESMERQNALLEIRARESALRENGHAHAADDYINAATEYLKMHKVL